ncbi:MAG: TonB-dependent receptor [Bryobacteraceae bacterium]
MLHCYRHAALRLALLFVLSLCTATLSYSQANTGRILGTVVDPSGAPVAGCRITVKELQTGVVKESKTDATGNYAVSYLLPGRYEVAAEAPSFRRSVEPDVNLNVDQKAEVDFHLVVGAVSETVEVTAAAPLLQTQSVEQGQVISEKQMQELPLNVRDFGQLATLQTGTVLGTGGLGNSYGPDNPQATGGAVNVDGLGQDANNWQLDGVSNNEAFFSIISVSPSLDAIQEFKVTTNNYSAEFGRAGGANVQVQIKSGTNHFSGGAFEFLRNDKLDANTFFNNQSGVARLPYRQNQFGAFLGGPIRKDKTFFFTDFEVLTIRQANTSIATLPTPLARQGIFTEPGQPTIYNPFNGQPFPNNTIPASLLNPTSENIIALMPQLNIPGAGLANNYIGASDLQHNRGTFDVRIDENFSEKDQFFARYSYLQTGLLQPSVFGTGLGDTNATTAYTRNQNGVVSEIHTFSPTTINEARVGINRVRTDWDATDATLETANQVGIPGINTFCGYCGGLPTINITGFSSVGHTAFAPTRRHDTVWQFIDNVTLIRGKHSLKFGAEVDKIDADLFQTANPVGEFDFNQNMTSNLGAGGSGMASFLLGYYDFAGRAALQVTPSARDTQSFFFAQDDYRVSRNLTLNLGLRYELYPPPTDQHNRLSNFDLATGDILVGCIAVSCNGGIKTDYLNLAPRLGFAYTPKGGRTTIRAGSGITYFQPGFGGQLGTLNDNFPYVTGQGETPPTIYTPGPSISQGLPPLAPVEQRPGAPAGHLIPTGGASSNGFSSVFYVPSNTTMTRVYQWSFGVQHQLTSSLLLEATYVGNVQNFVFLNIPGNVPLPGSDPSLTLQQRRPYYSVSPDLAVFTSRINAGRANYNSLQLKAEKRYSRGFSLLVGFTWSKAMNEGLQSPLNPFYYMVNELASNDTPRRLFASYVYELPFGRSRQFGSNWNGALDAVLGGWQISGITNYQTGFPFTPSITSNLDNGQGNQPDRVCNGSLPSPSINLWFNPACFVASPVNVFGNSGYDILRGPSFWNWDLTLAKNFALGESRRLQFRADLLNAFNQVAFGNPNTQVGVAGAGTITSTLPNTNPRFIQFGLKLYF